MINQLVMVGRVAQDPELKTLDSGKQVANITLAVPRNYKNAEGVYETDFINATLWNGVAENFCDYCKKGDMVGVKGRLESDTYEKDGNKVHTLNVVAEKVTFLSSKEKNTKENDIEDR